MKNPIKDLIIPENLAYTKSEVRKRMEKIRLETADQKFVLVDDILTAIPDPDPVLDSEVEAIWKRIQYDKNRWIDRNTIRIRMGASFYTSSKRLGLPAREAVKPQIGSKENFWGFANNYGFRIARTKQGKIR